MARDAGPAAYVVRRATLADLDELVRLRGEVLQAANGLPEGTDMARVEGETRAYYAAALGTGAHAAFIAHDKGGAFAACGGVSFTTVLPTWNNPTGQTAYIMNMYTRPQFRRQGLARRILGLLVDEARRHSVEEITLEATAAGRALYEAFGFVPLADEMVLPSAAGR